MPQCTKLGNALRFRKYFQVDIPSLQTSVQLNRTSGPESRTWKSSLSPQSSACFQPAFCFLSANYFLNKAGLHLADEVFYLLLLSWCSDPLVTSLCKVFISRSLRATGPLRQTHFSFKRQALPVRSHHSLYRRGLLPQLCSHERSLKTQKILPELVFNYCHSQPAASPM